MDSATNFFSRVPFESLQSILTLPTNFKLPAASPVKISEINNNLLIKDLLAVIFDKLSLPDRQCVSGVCKSWRKIENYEAIKFFLDVTQFHQKTFFELLPDICEVDGLVPDHQKMAMRYLRIRCNAVFAKALFNASLAVVYSLALEKCDSGILLKAQLPYFSFAAKAGAVAALPFMAALHMSVEDSGSACFAINEGAKKGDLICKLLLGKCYLTGAQIPIPKGMMHLPKSSFG